MEFNTKATQAKTSWQETGFLFDAGSLYDYLAKLKDSRKRRGIRYSLATIFVVLILAKLCGQDKAYGIADWAQQRSAFLGEAYGWHTNACLITPPTGGFWRPV